MFGSALYSGESSSIQPLCGRTELIVATQRKSVIIIIIIFRPQAQSLSACILLPMFGKLKIFKAADALSNNLKSLYIFDQPLFFFVKNNNVIVVVCFNGPSDNDNGKVEKTVCNNIVSHEFLWIRKTCDCIQLNAHYCVIFSCRVNNNNIKHICKAP